MTIQHCIMNTSDHWDTCVSCLQIHKISHQTIYSK